MNELEAEPAGMTVERLLLLVKLLGLEPVMKDRYETPEPKVEW